MSRIGRARGIAAAGSALAHTGAPARGAADAAQDGPYSVLGVSRDAEQPTITKAHRALAKRWHPDKGGDAEVFKLYAAAYATLSDAQKRGVYDATGEASLADLDLDPYYTTDERTENESEPARSPTKGGPAAPPSPAFQSYIARYTDTTKYIAAITFVSDQSSSKLTTLR